MFKNKATALSMVAVVVTMGPVDASIRYDQDVTKPAPVCYCDKLGRALCRWEDGIIQVLPRDMCEKMAVGDDPTASK